jgi:hypothetical protein
MEPEGLLLCSQEFTTGPCPKADVFTSHTISLKSIVMLSSHLGLPSDLLLSDIPTKIFYVFFISHAWYMILQL